MSQGSKLLDKIMIDTTPGEIILIGSRPNMGKTALALSIIHDIAKERQLPCLFITLETPLDQLSKRLDQMDVEADDKLVSGMFLPSSTIEQIVSICANEETEIKVIVIDYLQLIHGTNDEAGKRRLLQALKQAAEKTQRTIYLLSQVERSAEAREDKRPTVEDIKDYDAISEYITRTLFLYRDAYYNRVDEKINPAEIILPKGDGETDIRHLSFDRPGSCFF